MAMQNLWNLAVGQSAKVDEISHQLDAKYRERLMDIGLSPGQLVVCVRQTPFGGPKVYQIGQSLFSFDRDVCENVLIKGGARV